MEELRLVGVNDDGTRVVFVSPEGTRFTTPIDERLEAAARRDRARLGQLEIELSAGLRPRDIQARIRSGESAESVATTAGITMERVRRYAGPVLAEREHMAREARRAVVRRPAADGAPPRLGDIVTERLVARDVDVETVTWDAWRRDDGRWLVQVSLDDSTAATWLYDVAGRSVSAEDDEARLLSGERAPDADDVSLLADVIGADPPAEPAADHPAGQGRKQDSKRPFVPRLTAVGAEDAAGDDDEDSRRPIEISAARRTTAPRRERMVGHTDKQALADGVRPGRRATVPSWDDIVFGRRTTAE
jgi:Protein of unknown function (DUF3071)